MTPERWHHIQEILDDALARAPAAREAYVRQACGDDDDLYQEVTSLVALADGTATTPLDRPAMRLPEPEPPPPTPLTRLGPYRLIEALDRGGMGEVFLAERDDASYHQRVAIKILHAGLLRAETVQRFRSERQILAQLDHPNIAKLLDGGSTEDGRPYLVMELVEGVSIDVFCRRNELPIRARLRLFGKVCRAVQFAHQNLVVHRDLKPANILITDQGEPKLLDFGIAKLLSPEDFPQTVMATAPGLMPMTPEYASPEQVRGDPITTATDVYALGVLLYELLAGRRPYRLDRKRPQEALRAICEVAPPRPSSTALLPAPSGARDPASVPVSAPVPGDAARGLTRAWRRALVGDLDSIVLKALRKEPSRRYASAAELERDVDRHLEGQTVTARDATWHYRAGTFVRRHRLALGLATAAIVGTIAFIGALLVQRAETLKQQVRSERVSTFLTEIFAFPDPSRTLAESVTVREILDRGARQIEADLADQPAVQADLLATMGRTFKNLGLFEEAETHLTRALTLHQATAGRRDPTLRASLLHDLGHLRMSMGDYAVAESLAQRALVLRRRTQGSRHADVVRSLLLVGRIQDHAGDDDTAEATLTEALGIARDLDDREPLAMVLDRLGQLQTARAQYEEAEALFDEALVVQRQLFGPDHPTVALTLNNYAALLETLGEHARAEALLEEAVVIQRARYQDPHPYLAATLHSLGRLEESREQWDEAQKYYEEALAIDRAVQRGPHPAIGETLQRLAKLAHLRNDWDTAEQLYQESIANLEASVGEDHTRSAGSYDLYAQFLVGRGRLDEAEALYEKALALRRTLGAEHPSVAVSLANLADLSRLRRDFETAERLYQEALALSQKVFKDDHINVVRMRYNLALVQRSLGQLDEAAANLAAAESGLRRTLGDDHGEVALCLLIRGTIEMEQDRPKEAERLARDAQAIYRRGPSNPDGEANAAAILGKSLFVQERYIDAEPLLVATYEHYQKTRGPANRSTQNRLDQLIELYEAWPQPDNAARYRALRSTAP